MIEVDGLMAAVIPTPSASPSAAAPAEFAAALALVGGQAGQGGAEPGVEQELASEPVAADLLVETPLSVDADVLLADASVDADSLLDSESPAGGDLALSSLTVIAPAPAPTQTPSVPSPAPIGDAAAVSPSTTGEEIAAPIASTVDDMAIDAPAPADAPMAAVRPAQDVDSLVPADAPPGEPVPHVDPTVVPPAAVDPLAADSMPQPVAPLVAAADTRSATEVAAADRTPEIESANPDAEAVALPDPALSAGVPTTPAPSSDGESVDAAIPEGSVESIGTPTTPSTTESDVVVEADATPVPDAAPRTATSTPAVQPSAVSAPAPRADVTVADIADVPPTPATSPAEATPAQQVAEALREVRRLADGSHRLSLQLHPEELGAVQLEVAIRDGQLHVRAVAETEAARAALEQNLPELRSDLREAGVRAGSLEVGPDASGRDRPDSPDRDPRTKGSGEPVAEEHPTSTNDPLTSSGLDIRL